MFYIQLEHVGTSKTFEKDHNKFHKGEYSAQGLVAKIHGIPKFKIESLLLPTAQPFKLFSDL